MRSRAPLATLLAVLVAVPAVTGPGAVALEPPPAPAVDPADVPWPDPADLSVDAEAYVLVEGATGQVLAARAAERLRPVASTVKVLTALSVVERIDLDETVTVGDEVVGIEGAGLGLEPGDRWTVAELLDGLIARSGNDAAVALAAHVAGDVAAFAQLMDADARTLGLRGHTVATPSGLEDLNRLSARQLATLARTALADPRLAPALARPTVALPTGPAESRNLLLGRYPGATGVKTGFTEAAGYCLVASAERDGRELVAVVLGAGEDPARFDAAAELLDAGFGHFEVRELEARLELMVAGGAVGYEAGPVTVTAPVGVEARLLPAVTARPPAEAPAFGIRIGGRPAGEVDARPDASAGPAPVEGTAALGRAAVDGVYAALRAGAGAELLR